MAQIKTAEHLRAIIPDPGPRAPAKIRDHICEQGIAFIQRCPFAVLGTLGSYGMELSSKGDAPGFIEIVDNKTLIVPERKGNQLAIGLQNILADPRVGLLLVRPNTHEVLRISGRAELLDDLEICERLSVRGQPAVLAIKIYVDRAAFHCVRSAKRAGLWAPETWDAPTHISFGKIYADALGQPEVKAYIEKQAAVSDNDL